VTNETFVDSHESGNSSGRAEPGLKKDEEAGGNQVSRLKLIVASHETA